ncbi:dynamin-2B-like [Abrus precatorius]|uniref:dynamin GTPase n=1 Tax=Abrus precatorius TaxID=3816 RepID=A0A8B8LAV1_ABRPR|nr:dynamin-2B-like [Abrus precatorius]
MAAIEDLSELADSMRQAAALLADEDVDESSASSNSRRPSTFLNVVALGNVGAGKSAVLNSLIGHPVLPTGENGATRAPICIDLQRDTSLSSKSIILQIDNKSQQVSASALRHSLQDRISKGSSGRSRDQIYLKLRTSTAPSLKLVDLPGLDQRIMDESMVSEHAEHNDAILLVIVPAAQAPEIASSRALRVAKEYDGEGTRTIGVISKIDQAATDQKSLAAVQALLLNQGPARTSDIPWVALIGQSVSIATAQSGSAGSENSLETAWRAESESLKSILTGAPPSKLGRIALVDALAQQIQNRMKLRLPNLLSGLQGKSQIVQDELARLGESMVTTAEGTRAIALELCREFEDKFLQHITTGEGAGWKIVSCFEGRFPDRMKQLPLDRHFDINNVKRIVLEADGYQPYLISPEKGLRSLIKGVLELAKEPSRLCVDEVHRVLIDIVSSAANATPGLGRYPPFKREVVAIATAALEGFKNESKKMVVALVDMERAFVPPQHFIRLVQRRMERQRREEELKGRSSKKGQDAEQSILNRATSPQTGGSVKSMKEEKKEKEKDKSGQSEKEGQEGSGLKTAGPEGEITAGYLLKKSAKTNGWSRRWFVLNEKTGKLGYTKKQEERNFRGVITLEECNVEEAAEEDDPPSKSSKDKKSNGPDSSKVNLAFKITSRVPYKTVLKAHSVVVLKAESAADKVEWINKISKVIQAKGGQIRISSEGGSTMRHSLSDGSLDTMARRPADPEEELRWMSQEVRGYVEAVLNSLAANVPKAIVLCQVEKAKEDMLNQLYSSVSSQNTAKIEELLLEDQNVKRRRERYQKQSSLLSKLTRQLSIHDNRAAAASGWSNGSAESSPRSSGPGDDWRSAFDAAANGPVSRSGSSRSGSNGHSRHSSDPAQNGDVNSSSNSGSRRTPNRLPPAPPGSSGYKY